MGGPVLAGSKARKRRGVSASQGGPMTPVQARQDEHNTPQGGENARPKKRAAQPSDGTNASLPTIVAFRTRSGRGFDRVLDNSFSIERAHSIVRAKCGLPSDAPVAMWYETETGSAVQLDDDDDMRAFRVHAQREPTLVVNVDAETVEAFGTPQRPKATKAGAKKAKAPPQQQQQDDTDGNNSTAEVSAGLLGTPEPQPTAQPEPEPATQSESGKKTRRSRKRKQIFDDAMSDSSDMPLSSQVEVSQEPQSQQPEQEREAPPSQESESLPPTQDTADADVPASQDTGQEKTRRPRRTKAEMEVFRAEQAAKRAARDQEREQRKNKNKSPKATETPAEPADTTAVDGGDETTVVHEGETDVQREVDEIAALGHGEVDKRIQELKDKKQRKNGHERELQRKLLKYVKDNAGTFMSDGANAD